MTRVPWRVWNRWSAAVARARANLRRLLAPVVAGSALVCAVVVAGTGAQPPLLPPPRLAIVYGGGESTGPFEVRRAVDPGSVQLTVYAPGKSGEPLLADTNLAGFDLVFIDGTTPGLAEHREQIRAAAARTPVVVLAPPDGLAGSVDAAAHPQLAEYWANQSQDNYRHLVRYLVARVLGRPGAPRPEAPVIYPATGFYHPRAPKLFPSLEEYEGWERTGLVARSGAAGDVLTVGVTVSMASYLQKNLPHVDAIIAVVEARGHRAVTLAYRGAPDVAAFRRGDEAAVDVVIQTGSTFTMRDRRAAMDHLSELDVPVLGAFHHHAQSEAEYDASPTGLLPTLGSAVVQAEQEARFEPMAVSGRGAERGDTSFTEPYGRAIEWRVGRALAWAKLRHTPNRNKRLLFTYWSEGGGKANVGGDPDDFLDVPATVIRLLGEMRTRGYDVGRGALPDRDALSRRMALEGSNVGNWAPAELAARVARGEVRLVPEDEYRRWFEALPEQRRRQIVETWGPPPGNVGVYVDASGRRSLVVPGLVFGNVMFAPNPDWGYLQNATALMSTGELPPHHQYLAFFLWMQKTWRADAWVSFFSNISLQGGKPVGPLPDDHIGVLLGDVPHIHPERLGANGGLKSKRKALAQTISWYSIVRPAAAAEQYFELRAMLQRYGSMEDERLRPEAERLLRDEIERAGIARMLSGPASRAAGELFAAVQRELDRIDRMLVPAGSKVLGDAAQGEALVDMVTAMLGREFADSLPGTATERHLLARGLVTEVVVNGASPEAARARLAPRASNATGQQLARALEHAANLAAAPREVDALFASLDGRWIPPGSMDNPLRRPGSLPPGRSVYNFDSSEVPTAEAEIVGARQADALIAAHRQAHGGQFPNTLAFAIFSGEIATTRGVTEAQILRLLGTRAVRDSRGIVTGVELIPRQELGRPRVDVLLTTSGTYRDHYPDVMQLIAKASQLAATSPEDDNPVREAMQTAERALRESGLAAERAATLASARVFAPAAGAYSPNVQFLAKSGDQRGDDRKMAELYTSRLSHAYGTGMYGEAARSVFEQQLTRVDGASFARSSDVNGMLDNPMPAGFLGGLNLAAKAVTGRDLALYVSNLRDDKNPTLDSAAGEIQRELRTRYFNRSWVTEMQSHGYEGARTFMHMTDHLDLWDSTASQTVSSADWREVKQVYVDDSLGVDINRFFDTHNPHAQQVLLGNLLGAASRGHWDASPQEKAQVAMRLATSAAAHGIACEANLCRNPALTQALADALAGVPGGAAVIDGYQQALNAATTAPATASSSALPAGPNTARNARGSNAGATPSSTPAPASAIVAGQLLETVVPSATAVQKDGVKPTMAGPLVAGALFCLVLGWWRQGRSCKVGAYKLRDAATTS